MRAPSPCSCAYSTTSTMPKRRFKRRSSKRCDVGHPPGCPPARWDGSSRQLAAARIDRHRSDHARNERQLLAAVSDPIDAPEEEHDVRDDQLRLIFTCCHPALALNAQVALTLRLLGGLSTTEIARAFLIPEVTMAQRLV